MSVNNIGQIVALGAIGVVSISSVLVGIFYPEFFTGDIKLFGTNDIAPPLVEIIERIESTLENEDTINDTIETPVTPVVIAINESIDDNNIEPILEEVTILLDETTEEKKPSKNKTKSKSKKEEKHGSATSTKKHKKSHKEKILINPDIIQPL